MGCACYRQRQPSDKRYQRLISTTEENASQGRTSQVPWMDSFLIRPPASVNADTTSEITLNDSRLPLCSFPSSVCTSPSMTFLSKMEMSSSPLSAGTVTDLDELSLAPKYSLNPRNLISMQSPNRSWNLDNVSERSRLSVSEGNGLPSFSEWLEKAEQDAKDHSADASTDMLTGISLLSDAENNTTSSSGMNLEEKPVVPIVVHAPRSPSIWSAKAPPTRPTVPAQSRLPDEARLPPLMHGKLEETPRKEPTQAPASPPLVFPRRSTTAAHVPPPNPRPPSPNFMVANRPIRCTDFGRQDNTSLSRAHEGGASFATRSKDLGTGTPSQHMAAVRTSAIGRRLSQLEPGGNSPHASMKSFVAAENPNNDGDWIEREPVLRRTSNCRNFVAAARDANNVTLVCPQTTPLRGILSPSPGASTIFSSRGVVKSRYPTYDRWASPSLCSGRVEGRTRQSVVQLVESEESTERTKPFAHGNELAVL